MIKLTLQQHSISTNIEIENGFDFILSHFEQPVIFPRNVMATELIEQKKYHHFKIIYSREEALTHFKQYNYVDCRINAFPALKEGVLWKLELLFIDLDLADFKSIKLLDLALKKTLKNIKEKLNGVPTTIQSGNGYHIIQPIECPMVLENIEQFQKYDKPSQEFLRFAEYYLSNGKADKKHNPSFNSCLLRIPGSINSKCLDNREKRLDNSFRVKIVQRWNINRPPIFHSKILYYFHTYLNQRKSSELNIRQKKSSRTRYRNNCSNYTNYYYYDWIEKEILANPFPDGRKIIISLILAPYLINIKKLSYSESFEIIKDWLSKCNSLKQLDQRFDDRIKRSLKTAIEKKIPPMKLDTLREKNSELYYLLKN